MMSHRIVRQLGWVLWLLDAAVIVAGIIMFARTPGSNENGAMIGTFAMVIAFFTFPTMGALIIWQRPGNTVGWIFCFIGLGTAWTSFSAAFVLHALGNHTDTSFIVGLVDVLGNTVWPLNLGMATFLLFLFPTGRLPSPRWRFVFWLDVAVVALAAVNLAPAGLDLGIAQSRVESAGDRWRHASSMRISSAARCLYSVRSHRWRRSSCAMPSPMTFSVSKSNGLRWALSRCSPLSSRHSSLSPNKTP